MPRNISNGHRSTLEGTFTLETVAGGESLITGTAAYEQEPIWVPWFEAQAGLNNHDSTELHEGKTTFVFNLTNQEKREFPEAGDVVRLRLGDPREV